jgi:hypothetical protein
MLSTPSTVCYVLLFLLATMGFYWIINNDIIPNQNDPEPIHKIEFFLTQITQTHNVEFTSFLVSTLTNILPNYHTQHLVSELNKSLYCISKIQKCFAHQYNALKSLFYALMHSHITYSLILISCSSNKNISRITFLQKETIRIISKSNYHAHTDPIFKTLEYYLHQTAGIP